MHSYKLFSRIDCDHVIWTTQRSSGTRRFVKNNDLHNCIRTIIRGERLEYEGGGGFAQGTRGS